MSQTEEKDIPVMTTDEFKLKDKPKRFYQVINLKKQFGFVPEVIIIEKVRGKHNTLLVRAVIPQSELSKFKSNGESIRGVFEPPSKK